MLLPLRHVVGRVLAMIALLGYVAAVAEEVVPDCHDWDGVNAVVAPAVTMGQAPDQPAQPPAHPFHVCHEGHQHVLILADPGPALRPHSRTPRPPALTPDIPALAPLQLSLRPPIV